MKVYIYYQHDSLKQRKTGKKNSYNLNDYKASGRSPNLVSLIAILRYCTLSHKDVFGK